MKPYLCALLLLLPSCDQIGEVTDKLEDLKDLREKVSPTVEEVVIEPPVLELEEAEFYDFIAKPGKLQIVSFYTGLDEYSKHLIPILEEVTAANAGVAQLGKMHIHHARTLVKKEGVTTIPDIRFYLDGKMVHSFIGIQPREAIQKTIDTYIAPIPVEKESPSKIGNVLNSIRGKEQAPVETAPKPAPPEPTISPLNKDWIPPGLTPQKK